MAPSQVQDFFRDTINEMVMLRILRRINDFRPSDELVARIDYLACGANEGTLTPEEESEYLRFVDTNDLLAIWQAQARSLLSLHESNAGREVMKFARDL